MLVAAEELYAKLEKKAHESQNAAEKVIDLINDIGEVVYSPDDLDNDSFSDIDSARSAYDDLSDDEKALVTNYDELVLAEEEYSKGNGISVVGHSLSLDGDIGVNFYMDLPNSIIAHKDTAYMHFTIPTGSGSTTQDVFVKDARIVESDNETFYVFKCQVAAKEMTSEIKAQIIDGEKQGIEYTYSVKEYADYLIDHAAEREDLAKAVPLVKDMLNYGAYSQIYFEKNPTALANADLTDEGKLLGDVTIDIDDPITDNLPEGTTYEGATLSLKSETSLSLYFKSSTDLEFSCDGYTVEKATSGEYQIARIRGIKAKKIGDIYTLSVNGTNVKYSPLNYCKNALDGGTDDENLKNVVKALYHYWQAAADYFD